MELSARLFRLVVHWCSRWLMWSLYWSRVWQTFVFLLGKKSWNAGMDGFDWETGFPGSRYETDGTKCTAACYEKSRNGIEIHSHSAVRTVGAVAQTGFKRPSKKNTQCFVVCWRFKVPVMVLQLGSDRISISISCQSGHLLCLWYFFLAATINQNLLVHLSV